VVEAGGPGAADGEAEPAGGPEVPRGLLQARAAAVTPHLAAVGLWLALYAAAAVALYLFERGGVRG
jgi:hypothetical protein